MKVVSWSLTLLIGFLVSVPSGSAIDIGDAHVGNRDSDARLPALARKENGRHLAPCPPGDYCALLSEPYLTFSIPNDGYSTSLFSNTDLVCLTSRQPMVIVLDGLETCKASIGSVAFNLTRNGERIRYFVEKVYPYTVFGDTPTRVYSRRLPFDFTYKLEVTIKEKDSGCVSLFQTYEFPLVFDESCT
jgi:hypothetical protein